MGRAAEVHGVAPAARVREMLDESGTSMLVVACRLARLEADLHAAHQRIAELEEHSPGRHRLTRAAVRARTTDRFRDRTRAPPLRSRHGKGVRR